VTKTATQPSPMAVAETTLAAPGGGGAAGGRSQADTVDPAVAVAVAVAVAAAAKRGTRAATKSTAAARRAVPRKPGPAGSAPQANVTTKGVRAVSDLGVPAGSDARVGLAGPVPEPSGDASAPVAGSPIARPVWTNEDPWTADELDGVRRDLVQELGELRQEMDSIESSIADVLRDSGDGAGDDPADSGSKAYGREQELTFLAASRENIFQAEKALARIEDGTFGICEYCGGPIGKLRLQAFPRATLCVSCKHAQERR